MVCPYLPCLVTCVPLLHLPILNPLCLGHMLSTLSSFIKLASNVWCNSLCHARPYITDPMVRDKVLSYLKGWQINFSAVMQLSGLVRVQHRAGERPASKNRKQDLRGVESVIMSRVKQCLGYNNVLSGMLQKTEIH